MCMLEQSKQESNISIKRAFKNMKRAGQTASYRPAQQSPSKKKNKQKTMKHFYPQTENRLCAIQIKTVKQRDNTTTPMWASQLTGSSHGNCRKGTPKLSSCAQVCTRIDWRSNWWVPDIYGCTDRLAYCSPIQTMVGPHVLLQYLNLYNVTGLTTRLIFRIASM